VKGHISDRDIIGSISIEIERAGSQSRSFSERRRIGDVMKTARP
jgi:hypothetical protein